MPRAINRFVCECCGSEYPTEASAKECEAGHATTTYIKYQIYQSSKSVYPDEIVIKSGEPDDGDRRVARYKLLDVCQEVPVAKMAPKA